MASNVPDFAGPAAINAVGPSIYFAAFGGWIGGFPFNDNAPVAGALAEVVQIKGTRLGNFGPALYTIAKPRTTQGALRWGGAVLRARRLRSGFRPRRIDFYSIAQHTSEPFSP